MEGKAEPKYIKIDTKAESKSESEVEEETPQPAPLETTGELGPSGEVVQFLTNLGIKDPTPSTEWSLEEGE